MSNRNNWRIWEDEQPSFPNDQSAFAAQAPGSDPSTGATGGPPAQPQMGRGNENQPDPSEISDVENDPDSPDMPKQDDHKDFEQWKHEFFELSVKGNVNEMMASIQPVRDLENLESSQRRFVEDNIQILFYRQNDMVIPVTKEIRNLIKQDMDRTNPATTMMQHITATLEKHGLMQQVLIKLTGLFGLKSELHRKWLAALTGSIQVGGGNKSREDLVYSDTEYTVNISSRFGTQWGEINLGAWTLSERDPELYLTDPELERLQEGSPEEKQVLRRRIICESIAERFRKRAFLMHITHTDGTIYSLGWDMGTSIANAYKKGKLVVRGQQSQTREAMITDQGQIVPLIDMEVLYVRETDETDEDGNPESVEVPFIERRDSILYLVADLDTLHHAAASLSGMFFREMPYGGNPSDILKLQQCVPDLVELLNKQCIGNTVPLPSNVAAMGEAKPVKGQQEKIGPKNRGPV